MGTLDDVLGYLFGRPASATPAQGTTYPASPRLNYPTSEDVDFARKYDYSYGQSWAPEFENKSATILTGNKIKEDSIPKETWGTGKYELPWPKSIEPIMKDYYAKAALASEGSGLAKLGFDPTKFGAAFNTPDRPARSGEYYPDFDQGWADTNHPDAIVHESIHRGIQKLKGSPFWKPEFNEFYNNPSNEHLVRHLMEEKMGNPEAEKDTWATAGKSQRDTARFLFNKSPRFDERRKLLQQMEEAAANYVAAKHPGGPR